MAIKGVKRGESAVKSEKNTAKQSELSSTIQKSLTSETRYHKERCGDSTEGEVVCCVYTVQCPQSTPDCTHNNSPQTVRGGPARKN
jgi:hypothetical protein